MSNLEQDRAFEYIQDHLEDMVHGFLLEKDAYLDVTIEDFITQLDLDEKLSESFYDWAYEQIRQYNEPECDKND